MSIETFFEGAEAKVEAFVQKVVAEGEFLLGEIESALTNVSSLMPEAAKAVEEASAFVESLPGVGQDPDVMAVVAGANVAVQGLNAFASTWNQATAKGSSVTATAAKQAVLAGYQGYNTALAAAKQVKAVATNAASKPKTQAGAAPATVAPTPAAS